MGSCASCTKKRISVKPVRSSIGYDFWDDDGEDLHIHGHDILESGAIRLVSSTWLVLYPQEYVERCQELVRIGDAFCERIDAAQLFQELLGVVVLSYGWFTKEHPDPGGTHLSILRKFLKVALAAAPGLAMEKPDSYSKQAFKGLFWDFMCLPQPPRTEEQAATFEIALQGINILYGSPNTVVVQLKDLVTDRPFPDMNLTPYSDRGWTSFEEVTSSILKQDYCFLDICAARERLAVEHGKLFEEGSLEVQGDCNIVGIYKALEELALSHRRPPMHPRDFKHMLGKKQFTYQSDLKLIAKLYRSFFWRMCRRQKMLLLCKSSGPCCGFGWEHEEAICLSKALPAFKELTTLSINGHSIGNDGVQALASAVAGLPLRNLYLKQCSIGEPSLRSISGVLPKLPLLQLLVLPRALQDSDGSKVLREAWRRCHKPSHVEFDEDGWPKTGIHWVQGSAKCPPRRSLEQLVCEGAVVDDAVVQTAV